MSVEVDTGSLYHKKAMPRVIKVESTPNIILHFPNPTPCFIASNQHAFPIQYNNNTPAYTIRFGCIENCFAPISAKISKRISQAINGSRDNMGKLVYQNKKLYNNYKHKN